MPRALIIGGTGAIGRATAQRLLAAGWHVDVTGRDASHMPSELVDAGGRFISAERHHAHELAVAYGAGADLLVDCICFSAADAALTLPMVRDATSTVMISSKAVYVDADGSHSNSTRPPRFDGPVKESQPTLAPGTMDYHAPGGYGPNKVAAEHVLLESGAPVSVLRPSKVHGVGASPPREWHFVKRVLDGRRDVVLAGHGEGTDHPSAAVNIASLIETCAAQPGRRVLNSADPDAPTGLEISRTIANHFDHEWREVLLDDDAPSGLGWHPWDRRPPVVLDVTAARALGWQPVGDYAETVRRELEWLTPRRAQIDDGYFDGRFDYAAEDAWIAQQRHR
ncbi:MAG: NAD-dependent epimerase/dehydratase family protein [Acidimicrobiales bacterium]